MPHMHNNTFNKPYFSQHDQSIKAWAVNFSNVFKQLEKDNPSGFNRSEFLNDYFKKLAEHTPGHIQKDDMMQQLVTIAPKPSAQDQIKVVDCLLYASKLGSLALMMYYIYEFDAKIEEADDQGDTVLHVAANYGKFNLIKSLLSQAKCPPVSAKNKQQQTPLQLAIRYIESLDHSSKQRLQDIYGFDYKAPERLISEESARKLLREASKAMQNMMSPVRQHLPHATPGVQPIQLVPPHPQLIATNQGFNPPHGAFFHPQIRLDQIIEPLYSSALQVDFTLEQCDWLFDTLFLRANQSIPANQGFNPPLGGFLHPLNGADQTIETLFSAAFQDNYTVEQWGWLIDALALRADHSIQTNQAFNYHVQNGLPPIALVAPFAAHPSEPAPNSKMHTDSLFDPTKVKGGLGYKYSGKDKPLKQPMLKSARPRPGQKPIKFELTALNEIALADPDQSVQTTINTDWFKGQYYSHSSSGLPTNADKVTFVMAGRGMEALIPRRVNQQPTVLVMASTQFQELKDDLLSRLTDKIAYLVIDKLTQPWMNNAPIESDDLGLITSRRIATFLFAYHCQLDYFMMIDDNIVTINFAVDKRYNNSWNSLYDRLKTKSDETPITSVSTDWKSLNTFKKDELGSKCFMIHLKQLREHRLDPKAIFSLFPESMRHWGEDYYFQTAVQMLLQKKGFQILSPEDITLTRSKSQKNFAKNSVDQACIFEVSAHYQTYLQQMGYTWVNKAIVALNENTERNIKIQQAAYDKSLAYDCINEHAKANNIESISPITQDQVGIPQPLDIEQVSRLLNTLIHYEPEPQPEGTPLLRAHQQQAIEFFRANLPTLMGVEPGVKQLQFDIATGCGKTLIQLALAMAIYSAPGANKVVIITPQQPLVEQMYSAFQEAIDKFPQFSALNVPFRNILKVASMQGSLEAQTVAKSSFLADKKAILICCERSFNRLNEYNPNFYSQITCVFADESHCYKKYPIEKRVDAPVVKFSATPPVQQRIPTFSYQIQQAIHDRVLAPFVIDKIQLSDENTPNPVEALLPYLASLIEHQIHPLAAIEGDTPERLCQLKGIIFFDTQEQAKQAQQLLQNRFKVYLVMTDNIQFKKDLEAFKASEEAGIVLAVGMLKLGFDLPELHWFINLKTKQSAEDKAQILGRVTRPYGNKTAYGLVLDYEGYTSFFIYPGNQWPISLDYLAQDIVHVREKEINEVEDIMPSNYVCRDIHDLPTPPHSFHIRVVKADLRVVKADLPQLAYSHDFEEGGFSEEEDSFDDDMSISDENLSLLAYSQDSEEEDPFDDDMSISDENLSLLAYSQDSEEEDPFDDDMSISNENLSLLAYSHDSEEEDSFDDDMTISDDDTDRVERFESFGGRNGFFENGRKRSAAEEEEAQLINPKRMRKI
ncbi:DEAD/DEAH box helicase family protein [Legionella yabuuchiae]|uniref:DEAD/DEAH box helicase family protein n=1 Tax=Legionella yabuuchiae TaxID=376727 RepID=UPI0010548F24|nr:DEAD/DEAH box helicase family protein [Legionella yabuuchiae]